LKLFRIVVVGTGGDGDFFVVKWLAFESAHDFDSHIGDGGIASTDRRQHVAEKAATDGRKE
jgi:hypothetical protein